MLYIKKLSLRNFMNIEKADFEFSQLNMIFGKPASGKSAIFEAISICLSSNKRSLTYGEYVLQGKDNAKIYMEFELNGFDAVSDLTINKVGGTPYSGTLTYKDKTYKNSEIQEFIKNENIEYYVNIMFTMQHDKDVTELSPARRLEYIQQLFNFNFESQKMKINEMSTKDKDSMKELQGQINAQTVIIESLKKEEPLRSHLLTEEDKLKLKSEIELLEKRLVEYDKIEKTRADFQSQLDVKRKEVSSVKTDIALAESKIESLKRTKAAEEKKLDEKLFKETELKTLEEQITVEQRNYDQATKDINESSSSINDSQYKLQELEFKSKENEKKLMLIAKGKCPECGQSTENLGSKKDLEDESLKFSSTIESLSANVAKAIDKRHALVKNQEEIKSRLDDFKAKKVAVKTWLDNCHIDNTIDTSIAQAQQQISAFTLKLQKLEQEETQLFKNIQQVPAFDSNISKEISDMKEKLHQEELVNVYNEGAIKRNAERKDKLSSLDKSTKDLQDTMQSLNSNIEVYDEAYNVLAKLLPQYMSVSVCEALQKRINEFINIIFPSYFVKMTASKKGCELHYTKNKNISDEKRNNYLDARMSSGLERCVLNLAFKVALAEAYNLDVFVGDEIDKAANDDDSVKLMNALMSKQNYRQIFLISHKKSTFDYLKDKYEDYIYYETDSGKFKKRD